MLLVSDFVVSDEDGVLLLDDEDDGVLESDEDGVLLEPDAALGVELELDGVLLDEDEDDPPLALSFLFRSIDVDEELEPEGEVVLGAAVVPLADEDEEPEGAVLGEVVAPDGEVVEDELEERSAARSHAVISVAPSASETATARVETLMWPPWLGYWKAGANIGPRLLNHYRFNVSGPSVLRRRLRVTRARTVGVLVRLEVAMLVGVLRIDLPLRRVRPLAFLARRRRAGARRCRGRSCGRLWNSRRGVGFRRRRCSGIAITSRNERCCESKGQDTQFHRWAPFQALTVANDVPCAP